MVIAAGKPALDDHDKEIKRHSGASADCRCVGVAALSGQFRTKAWAST